MATLLGAACGGFLLLGPGCRAGGQAVESLAAPFGGGRDAGLYDAAQLETRFGGICHDPVSTARVKRVGRRVGRVVRRAGIRASFRLLNSAEPNALSLSDGSVYVTLGLFGQLPSDDLLAAAVAHELAHIVAQDGLKPCDGAEEQLGKELGADRNAARYLAAAGYDSRALIALLRILSEQQAPGWAERRITALSSRLDSGTALLAPSRR